jgi:Family of unknown function (DUF6152)
MNPSVKLLRRLATCLLLVLSTLPASAHHSGAMFDGQKTTTLQGTVKDFRWGNPHCWIQLVAPKDGIAQEWSIEMGSTTQLYRSGWRPTTLKVGDKVAVAVHPLRDGTAGAQFVSAQGADGAPLGKAREASAP